MTKTSTTRVHNRKTVNLRKKLLCVMAVSAASLLSSSALANTETISVPQIVNETTLQDVGKHLASYNEFFLTELGAIWVDGVQLDLSNVKLTGNSCSFARSEALTSLIKMPRRSPAEGR